MIQTRTSLSFKWLLLIVLLMNGLSLCWPNIATAIKSKRLGWPGILSSSFLRKRTAVTYYLKGEQLLLCVGLRNKCGTDEFRVGYNSALQGQTFFGGSAQQNADQMHIPVCCPDDHWELRAHRAAKNWNVTIQNNCHFFSIYFSYFPAKLLQMREERLG